ncbi:hypothetical protein BH23CYA1_BH23CYA1_18860 [soil metagenome]
MTSIQITTKIDLDQLIAGVTQLETSELEVYAEKISLLVAQRKAVSPSAQEANLLKTINRSLPVEVETRHSALQDKVHDENITAVEHKELIELIKLVEQAEGAGRLTDSHGAAWHQTAAHSCLEPIFPPSKNSKLTHVLTATVNIIQSTSVKTTYRSSARFLTSAVYTFFKFYRPFCPASFSRSALYSASCRIAG